MKFEIKLPKSLEKKAKHYFTDEAIAEQIALGGIPQLRLSVHNLSSNERFLGKKFQGLPYGPSVEWKKRK